MTFIQYIVISYKSPIKNLLKLQKLSRKVMFVDNSNFRPSKKIKTSLNIISLKNNLGYGGGANVGINDALKRGVKWVVILNQDLKITKSALNEFEHVIARSRPGIIGPFPGELDKNRWSTILPAEKADYISGSFIAIHRDVVKRIGLFYEPFFMYYEDVDYCIRAKEFGFPLTALKNSGIAHEDNSSLGKKSYLLEYYLARNHMLFVQRQAPLKVKLHEYLRVPKTLNEYIKSNNKGGIDGIKDYFVQKFGEKQL